MIWIAWRQQRATLITIAVVLVGGAAALMVLRSGSTAVIEHNVLAACVLDARNPECLPRVGLWRDSYYDLMKYVQAAVVAVPLLLGMFCGAPLFARELEQGTHVLAFTQSVSRARWMAVKLAVALLPSLVTVVVLQFLFNGWADSAGQIGVRTESPVAWSNYDTTGLMPVAHTIFAFGVGVFVGIVGRRSLLAMTVTFGVFVVARVGVNFLRPSMVTAERATAPYGGGVPVPRGSLYQDFGHMDAAGRIIPDAETIFTGCIQAHPNDGTADCMAQAGVAQSYADFVSPDAYWALQLTETAIFGVAALALLAGGVWWLRSRV